MLSRARERLAAFPKALTALDDLEWLANRVGRASPDVAIGIDLADLGTNPYYSGCRFAVYAEGAVTSLVRGGRYDAVGAVFGRERPAVGFGLDVKALAEAAPRAEQFKAIRAPSQASSALRARIRALRAQGEVVLCLLPGHEGEVQEFECDRQLVERDGQWCVEAL